MKWWNDEISMMKWWNLGETQWWNDEISMMKFKVVRWWMMKWWNFLYFHIETMWKFKLNSNPASLLTENMFSKLIFDAEEILFWNPFEYCWSLEDRFLFKHSKSKNNHQYSLNVSNFYLNFPCSGWESMLQATQKTRFSIHHFMPAWFGSSMLHAVFDCFVKKLKWYDKNRLVDYFQSS